MASRKTKAPIIIFNGENCAAIKGDFLRDQVANGLASAGGVQNIKMEAIGYSNMVRNCAVDKPVPFSQCRCEEFQDSPEGWQ